MRSFLAGIAVLVLPATLAQAQGQFPLGPGDKLAISVHKRPDLSTEARVLPDGTLALPFVRPVPATGLPLSEVTQAIVARLREDAFLIDPRVMVQIVETRPVYVAGAVRKPGSYAFEPGMTVLHAMAMAGGRRMLDTDEITTRVALGGVRERIRASNEAVGLAMVRRDRLRAEKARQTELPMPPGIGAYLSADRAGAALDSERTLLRDRTETLATQFTALAAQNAVFEEEITALHDQSDSKRREAELLEEESRYQGNLMRQGLAPRTSRVVELQRLAVQIEGERRQIMAFVARARQQIAQVNQSGFNLKAQRQLEITQALRDAEDAIESQRIALAENRAILADTGGLTETLARAQPDEQNALAIIRPGAAGPVRLAAREDTPLNPGDLLSVGGH